MPLIPTRLHAILDYLVGALIVASPWLLGFAQGGAETWIPVALGLAALGYSLLTDYELGLVRRIPMPIHLAFDVVGGTLLAFSPWLFGFAEFVRDPHVLLGAFEVAVSLLTRRQPAVAAEPGGRDSTRVW